MGKSEAGPRRRSRKATLVALLGATAVLFLVGWYVVVPYPWTLRQRDPERTSLMEQRIREARARGEELEIRQEWIALDDVSRALVRAVLVAEDYRFREHHGVDWVSLAEEVHWSGDEEFSWWSPSDLRALAGALSYAWSNRADLRGRSTITQQLAKNLYFGTDRSFVRKAMEFVVAGRLEKRLGKDRILEIYLNVAEWGPGIFGAEAAARTYFGHSARELTLTEAAALAATLPQPLTSNPAHDPGRMRWRQSLILDRLDPARGLPPPPGPLPDIEIDLMDVDLGDVAPAAPIDTTDPAAVPLPEEITDPVTLSPTDSLMAPDGAR
ncbi:MAG: transglycosylase domain-containing protein [Gemmatimonadales bacterium]